jgi:hypothetical protein
MCFSATASFAASAALVPAGIYCTKAAVRKDPSYVPLAFVPFAFAIQQLCEGLVWLGLGADDAYLVQGASVAYLFFAIALWPFWIPLCLLCTERRRGMTWLLAIVAALGLAWIWLYSPILFAPADWLTTEVVHHSIRYEVGDLPAYHIAAPTVWNLAYLAMVCVPLLIGCTREQRFPGDRVMNIAVAAALAGSFAVIYYLYWQVFVSVWCFFAAMLALVLCYVFYRLPVAGIERWQPWPREMAARG